MISGCRHPRVLESCRAQLDRQPEEVRSVLRAALALHRAHRTAEFAGGGSSAQCEIGRNELPRIFSGEDSG